MDEQTQALVTALMAVNAKIPLVVEALAGGTLAAKKQREFAELLTQLGELLGEHATGRATSHSRPPSLLVAPGTAASPGRDQRQW